MNRGFSPPAPEKWESSPLKHACTLNPEVLPDSTPEGEELEYVDIAALDGDSADLAPKKMLFGQAPSRARRVLRSGDTILSTVRTYLKAVANFPTVDSNLIASTGFAVIRPNGKLDPRFAYWAVLATPFIESVVANSDGVSYPAINPSILGSLPVTFPNRAMQVRIANFLDEKTARIDALIAEKELLLAKLVESEESQTLSLITGLQHGAVGQLSPHRPSAADLPKGWKLPQLARLVSKLTNGFVGPTRDILVSSGVRYLQSLHIKEGRIDFSRGEYHVSEDWSQAHAKSILELGDVLIVQTGDIGQTAVVQPDFVGCNCHALIIATPRQDIVIPEYLELVLRSTYGRACFDMYSTGALHPHLNCSNIRDIRIPLPQLGLQREIVANAMSVRDAHFRLSQHVREHINRLREYRSSLISAAVTGQMEVNQFQEAA